MFLRFIFPYIFVISLSNILFKVAVSFDIHPLVFTCQGFVFGAITLLSISKAGSLSIDTLKTSSTWIYGVIFLWTNVLFIYSLEYVDVFMFNLLCRMGIILSMLAAFLFMGRKPTRLALLAASVLTACIGLLMTTLDSSYAGFVILLAVLVSLSQASKAFTQETHKTSLQASEKGWAYECRVTGLVLGATAMLFFILVSFASTMDVFFDLKDLSPFIPTPAQIFNPYSLLFALVYGFFGVSYLRYLEFKWIKKVKAERFIALLAFIPITTVSLEILADYIGLVSFKGLTHEQWIIALVILATAIVILIGEARQNTRKAYKACVKQREKDRDLAQYAMNRNKGDKEKTAEMLNISEHALASALGETDEDLTPEISQKLQENFTHHMAFIDSLTGLMNRSKFMQQLEEILNKKTKGVLVYLDLDKFKPINDTHGHAVGDAVLRIVSQRFRQHIRGAGFASRLGGDEFACVIVKGSEKDVKALIQSIEEPIQIDGIEEALQVGASSGVISLLAKGKTAAEVLDQADKRMYENKKAR